MTSAFQSNRRELLKFVGAAGVAGLHQPALAAGKPKQSILIAEGARLPFVLPVLDLIAKGGGFEWEPIHVPWPRLMFMLNSGESLAWAVSRTPERENTLNFSEVVNSRHVWLIAPPGQPQASPPLASLKGHTYCKRRGFTLDSPLNEAMQSRYFHVVEADLDYDAVLRMLLAGRCEGVMFTHRSDDPAVVERRIETLLPGRHFVVQRPPLATGALHIAAAKRNPQLIPQLQRVNEGLRAQAKGIADLIAAET